MIKYLILLVFFTIKIFSYSILEVDKSDIKKLKNLYIYGIKNNKVLILGDDKTLKKIEKNNIHYRLSYKSEKDFYLKQKSIISNESFVKYDEVVKKINELSLKYPNMVEKIIIGNSVQGRKIIGLKTILNDKAPKYRIVGGIHGNEAMSYQFVYDFMVDLIENHKKYNDILEKTQIYFIPMLNPDGAVNVERRNANNVDLNRNLCFFWKENLYSSDDCFNQPESKALRDFTVKENFTISFSFHTFGDIINYVWNFSPDKVYDLYEILNLSEIYKRFTDYEVTEGYLWYQTIGDLNDYSYGITGCLDWTIEIDDSDKNGEIYKNNKKALLDILKTSEYGVEGVVKNEDGEIIKAAVMIDEGSVFYNYENGYFYRYLLNGVHSIKVIANGYDVYEDFFKVDFNKPFFNIVLKKKRKDYVFVEKLLSLKSQLIKYEYYNVTLPKNLFFEPDNYYFILPKGGEITLFVPDFDEDFRILNIVRKSGLPFGAEISLYEDIDKAPLKTEIYADDLIKIKKNVKYVKLKASEFELYIDAVLFYKFSSDKGDNRKKISYKYRGSGVLCNFGHTGNDFHFIAIFLMYLFYVYWRRKIERK